MTWRRFRRLLRAAAGMAIGGMAVPLGLLVSTRPRDPIAAAVADMLMIGFHGTTRRSPTARLLAAQLRAGRVGGVFFVLQNIGTRADVAGLVRLFGGADPPGAAPMLAIDHEGGTVQRLVAAHGFTPLPCARDVAATMTPAAARAIYAQAGRELRALGFTINLAPVVDVDDPANPAIGVFGRSFGTDPERIAAYAAAFVDGFDEAGVRCAVKHFPGHGRSRGDSHSGPADISADWSEAELVPFRRLIESGRAAMVMGGHLRLDRLEPSGAPSSMSAAITTGLLRGRLRFAGVTVTDDLDMDAVAGLMGRQEAVVGAIAAGNDLLVIKNLFRFDPLLPRRAVSWVRAAIRDGRLTDRQVLDAAGRIRALRRGAAEAGPSSAGKPGGGR